MTHHSLTVPGGAAPSKTRREVLKLAPVLALGALLVPRWRDPILRSGLAFSDAASALAFRRDRLARTYADADVVPLQRFPYNSYVVDDPEVDLDAWQLEVSGLVARPGPYTLERIKALPKRAQNTRHICVEGWDVIGNFGGARIADFLRSVGADPHARFLEVGCADDYYESLDMESALHPQSLLGYEMYGAPLERGHGAPLRLQLPTKLGYKQAKYLTSLRVTNVLGTRRGYWEDRGYSWHGGL